MKKVAPLRVDFEYYEDDKDSEAMDSEEWEG
jgi:hypothetical protein